MTARLLLGMASMAMVWPVGAQAADYGGGTAPESFSKSSRQLTLVGLRTTAKGRVRVALMVSARCGFGAVRHTVAVKADGSFGFDVFVRSRVRGDRTVRQRARIAVLGRISGATASGIASTRLVQRRGGRVIRRCRSGRRPWQARAATAQPVFAAPVPRGAYYGLTSQRVRRPFPFVLRVSPNARRVRIAAFDYRQRCGDGAFEFENLTPSGPIAADGSFRLRERFPIRWAEGVERYRVRVDGRFTAGGVSGTLSVSSVLRSPSGRVLDRCRTGRVGFAAQL